MSWQRAFLMPLIWQDLGLMLSPTHAVASAGNAWRLERGGARRRSVPAMVAASALISKLEEVRASLRSPAMAREAAGGMGAAGEAAARAAAAGGAAGAATQRGTGAKSTELFTEAGCVSIRGH